MKKINIKIITLILLGLSWYLGYKIFQFPVEYLICSSAYTDCFVSAKFKNLNDCESANEMGGWLCDATNPNDIKCKVSVNSVAVGYCKD